MLIFIIDKYSLASQMKLLTSLEKVESISTIPKKAWLTLERIINTKFSLLINAISRKRQNTFDASKFGSSKAHGKLVGNFCRSFKLSFIPI